MAVALAMAVASAPTVAAREPEVFSADGRRDLSRLLENPQVVSDLGLTTGQVTSLRDKLYDIRRQIIDLKAKIDLARLELEYLTGSEEIDEKKAFALTDEVKQLETAVGKLRIAQTQAENSILTPKQRQILAKIYQGRRPSSSPHPGQPTAPQSGQQSVPGQGRSLNSAKNPPPEQDQVEKALEEYYQERRGK
jgi:Spy/CpxP family protein refolding chaperone